MNSVRKRKAHQSRQECCSQTFGTCRYATLMLENQTDRQGIWCVHVLAITCNAIPAMLTIVLHVCRKYMGAHMCLKRSSARSNSHSSPSSSSESSSSQNFALYKSSSIASFWYAALIFWNCVSASCGLSGFLSGCLFQVNAKGEMRSTRELTPNFIAVHRLSEQQCQAQVSYHIRACCIYARFTAVDVESTSSSCTAQRDMTVSRWISRLVIGSRQS